MEISQALKQAELLLKSKGITTSHLDALILLEHSAGHSKAWLLAHPEEKLTSDQTKNYLALTNKRAERVPIAQLTGTREFYGLDFIITPAVMIPRVETEKMVEWAIQYAPRGSKLIDIGTGCGAIGLAIAFNRPDLEIWASDISPSALEVAQRNSDKHKLNTNFIQSDLFSGLANAKSLNNGSTKPLFSTIVTNLPYLLAGSKLLPEAQLEPSVALFSDAKDGLSLYRRFLSQLPEHLEPGGCLFTESDPWQQPDLIQAAQDVGLKLIEQDYFILGFQLPAASRLGSPIGQKN